MASMCQDPKGAQYSEVDVKLHFDLLPFQQQQQSLVKRKAGVSSGTSRDGHIERRGHRIGSQCLQPAKAEQSTQETPEPRARPGILPSLLLETERLGVHLLHPWKGSTLGALMG